MPNIQPPESIQDLPGAIIRNVISLSTSGFGVVVALAWNDAIKAALQTYVDPYVGKSGGVVSLAIYAVVITLLAVFVTMQLSAFQKNLEVIAKTARERISKKS
jgi:hypothetical protein